MKDLESGLEIGNLTKKDNSPLGSYVEKALGRKASARSPGFETFYGVIFLIVAFLLFKKR